MSLTKQLNFLIVQPLFFTYAITLALQDLIYMCFLSFQQLIYALRTKYSALPYKTISKNLFL